MKVKIHCVSVCAFHSLGSHENFRFGCSWMCDHVKVCAVHNANSECALFSPYPPFTLGKFFFECNCRAGVPSVRVHIRICSARQVARKPKFPNWLSGTQTKSRNEKHFVPVERRKRKGKSKRATSAVSTCTDRFTFRNDHMNYSVRRTKWRWRKTHTHPPFYNYTLRASFVRNCCTSWMCVRLLV